MLEHFQRPAKKHEERKICHGFRFRKKIDFRGAFCVLRHLSYLYFSTELLTETDTTQKKAATFKWNEFSRCRNKSFGLSCLLLIWSWKISSKDFQHVQKRCQVIHVTEFITNEFISASKFHLSSIRHSAQFYGVHKKARMWINCETRRDGDEESIIAPAKWIFFLMFQRTTGNFAIFRPANSFPSTENCTFLCVSVLCPLLGHPIYCLWLWTAFSPYSIDSYLNATAIKFSYFIRRKKIDNPLNRSIS